MFPEEHISDGLIMALALIESKDCISLKGSVKGDITSKGKRSEGNCDVGCFQRRSSSVALLGNLFRISADSLLLITLKSSILFKKGVPKLRCLGNLGHSKGKNSW